MRARRLRSGRSARSGRSWIGLLAAMLLLTGSALVTTTVRAMPAHAWDIEDCSVGFDCPGDPSGGSLGNTDDCLWESCGQIDDLGSEDPGDDCDGTSCDDGQNPPVKQCEVTVDDDGTLHCTVTAPGPDDPPPPDCLTAGVCPNPIGEQPINPATCSPNQDGPGLFFNQDNFTSASMPIDPFPDLDPLYNDNCPPMTPPPAPADQFGATDVAFGDSFISGEGAPPFDVSPTSPASSDCDVSKNAWPFLVYGSGTTEFFASGSTAPFENWACTGGVISQIQAQVSAAQAAGDTDFNDNDSDFAGLGADTESVEISAGGNDLGFGPDLKCAWHNPTNLLPDSQRSKNSSGQFCIPTPNALQAQVSALIPKLTSLYKSIDTGDITADVNVVGYPMFFPASAVLSCGSKQTGVTRTDQINTNNDVLEVDDAIRRAAAAAGANYVDFSTALQGATICDRTPGVNTVGAALNAGDALGAFHPNAVGYSRLATAYMRGNFFPAAGVTPATVPSGTLVGDRIGDDVYVAAGGTLFPFAAQAEVSASPAYKNSFITLEPSIQVATQLETAPAVGTFLRDSATGVIFDVEKTTGPGGVALIPEQSTTLPATTVPDEALAAYPIAGGSFVKVAGGDGVVYQIVGGAPVPVTNSANVGGTPIIGTISANQFNGLAQVPADGTFVKNASGTVYEFAGGAPIVVTSSGHVTGEPQLLEEIDETAIDDASSSAPFNHINQYPANGTFVTATVPGTSTVNTYEFVGGAPIAVTSFDHVGGTPSAPIPSIDQTALDDAGQGGVFNHVRPFPADGTYVTGQGAGSAPVSDYVFAGGAPIPITDWTHLGGSGPATPPNGTFTVDVDETALDNAGSGGEFSHVRQYPADGTIMLGNGSNVFVVAGGAPTFVDNFEDIGGARPAVSVDQNAIDKAGSGGVFSHLRFQPADGTILESFGTGHVFVVAGGAPLRVSSLTNIDRSTVALGGSPPPAVFVDEDALEKAGSGGFFNHLSFKPADNTLLSLLAGNSTNLSYFVVAGGAPIYVPDIEDIGGARPSVIVDETAIDGAGSGGDWLHLSMLPANGTLIESFDTGHVYQITGGVPILDCAVKSSPTLVAQDALTKAGTGGFFNHLKPLPTPPPPACPAPPSPPGPQL